MYCCVKVMTRPQSELQGLCEPKHLTQDQGQGCNCGLKINIAIAVSTKHFIQKHCTCFKVATQFKQLQQKKG